MNMVEYYLVGLDDRPITESCAEHLAYRLPKSSSGFKVFPIE